jgi:hypothetical protein
MLKNVGRLRPELWQQENWLLPHNKAPSYAFFLARELLTNSNMAVDPYPS